MVVNSNRFIPNPGNTATDILNHLSDVNKNHVSRLGKAKFLAKRFVKIAHNR